MSKRKRNYHKEWKKRPYWQKIAHWNKSTDKKKGLENNLSSEQTKIIIEQPCFYCGTKPALGVERIDNNLGHVVGNCLSACTKCNVLLTDLPFEAKLLLRDGLRKIREQGLFELWEIPTKRFIK